MQLGTFFIVRGRYGQTRKFDNAASAEEHAEETRKQWRNSSRRAG